MRFAPRRNKRHGSVSVKSDPKTGTSRCKNSQSCGTNENVTVAAKPSRRPLPDSEPGWLIACAAASLAAASSLQGCTARYLRSRGYAGSPYQIQFFSQCGAVRTIAVEAKTASGTSERVSRRRVAPSQRPRATIAAAAVAATGAAVYLVSATPATHAPA